MDGDGRDAFVRASESVCLPDDLPADLAEVCELFALRVEKLSIFWEDRQMGIKMRAADGTQAK